MLKLFGRKTERDQEEDKKEEEMKDAQPTQTFKKKSPGEIRLKKEVAELDLPTHSQVIFPDESNIMKFEVYVDLFREECLWKGAKYKFTVCVPPNYPHEAPKCHCDT